MSSEIPPTVYFDGITFNPDFYQSTSSDYLTPSTGKSYFLSYPTAQGTETIPTLNTSTLTSTGLITSNGISNTGNISSTTSITTPKLDSTDATTDMFIGSNITTSDITIAGGQTTGILNIGTGSRTNPAVDSAINIGTAAVGLTKVNIGTADYTTISLDGVSVDVSTKITSPA